MNEDLYKIVDELISQNLRLGQKQIAMECVCSSMLAQIAMLSPEPVGSLDRINAELCGTAMGVAAGFKTFGMAPEYDTTAITAVIESISQLSEKALAAARASVSPPVWA